MVWRKLLLFLGEYGEFFISLPIFSLLENFIVLSIFRLKVLLIEVGGD
jgi:hypothetical protein